ncbi:hypothetical protein D8B26_005393 [Coccidioides posadasii str. Silveira]|uniref:Uncharacterized protein n=1 Tax=Coccidioides posadasii (strain RMSCC 757 / Silveira) TaxID=443226 RepID=E9D570_COCPS|nr:conserved hypothetical protein [Coccidioides posadasii str. Silveira]QVM10740.1 hypothetical protein D8B26_005393 [Coccidioides posadasii str. Silveira]
MESISNTASKASKAGRPVLLSFDEMPEWFRHESNQWILHGYRPISGSAHASFCSWLYIHNETVNIYSHLIPAIFFLLGEYYMQQYLASRYSGFTGTDFIAFSIFMLTAVICLSLSATYHTLMNHSKHMERFCLRLDMLGIVVFILGDLILGIYMVFWCEPLPRKIYWSMIGVFGALTIFMTMHSKFQGRKYRLFRALLFVVTGLSGVAPLIHGLNVFGTSQMMRKSFSLHSGKSRLPAIWDFVLCSQVSRKSISWQVQPMGLSFHISHPGGMHRIGLDGYLDAFDYAQTNLMCSSI